jgi:hypothetical protein
MISNLYKILEKVAGWKIELLVYRLIKLFLIIVYPICCRLNKSYGCKRIEKKVIVSLTSFPARINTVWIIIETLLRQTCKPEMIILWLAESQFPSLENLPKSLLNLQRYGLTIKFCDDLRSHKKYFYTMKNYPEYIIITVDDDTFYPEDLVENLMLAHKKYPNTICCNFGHVITTKEGTIEPYSKWNSGVDGYNQPSDYLVPIGCEGVLYPPGSLMKDAFDKGKILELCPLADDLWLKSMASLKGVKAVRANPISIPYANLMAAGKSSLSKINVIQNMNDMQLNNIIKRYPELHRIWK